MRGFFGCVLCLVFSYTALGADTFVAFGLTNVTFGDARYGPSPYGDSIINLSSNGSGGVTMHLGQADGAVFVYPHVYEDPPTGAFMTGRTFGSVNGETNREISYLRCHEERDGYHPLEINFSGIGASQMTFLLYKNQELVAQSAPQPGSMVVYGNYFDPYYCRINPFWRLPDGSVGALIEFQTQAEMELPGIEDPVTGNRLFIRAENPTNIVNYATHVDIAGGGELDWFRIYDARIGAFGRAHKALGTAHLHAQNGPLRIANLLSNIEDGVAIELEAPVRFDVGLVPLQLGSNSAVYFSGIGHGTNGPGEDLGTLTVYDAGEAVEVFVEGFRSNTIAIISRNGEETGRASTNRVSIPVTARIAGATLQATTTESFQGIRLRLEQAVPITVASNIVVEGNEIYFAQADGPPVVLLETMLITAHGLESFTLTNEVAYAVDRPKLNIRRDGEFIELSWLDPFRIYWLDYTSNLSEPFRSFDLNHSRDYAGDEVKVWIHTGNIYLPRQLFWRLALSPPPEVPE